MITFTTITWVIIAILLFDFFLERGLAWLNAKNVKSQLPEALNGLYDADEYAKQQNYFKTNQKFGLYTGSFNLLLILAMFAVGGFAIVNNFAYSVTSYEILSSLIFFGIIYIVYDLLNTPFEVYGQFVIEERFGFNKVTRKLFVTDKLKSWILGAIIGGGLIALIEWIYFLTADKFWFFAWVLIGAFSIFLTMFYSNLIVPMFNKQTPLEEGELRDAIERFSKEAGFKLNNIFVIDGSKRSTKANAYFTGLGTKKRIVLYDTLIDELDTNEIVAVLAHEIGHYKKKHTTMSLVLSLLNSLIMLYLLGLFLNSDALAWAFCVEKANFHINLLAFGLLYTPVSLLLGLIINVILRKNEYEADAYAARFGLGDSLISALKKLSVKSLSNLQPHPAYVFFYYSHPTLLQRMQALSMK